VPFLSHLIDGDNPFDLEYDGILFTIAYSFVTIVYSIVNYCFVFFAVIDFQRRLYMIKAMGSMITPYKENIDTKFHMFPTINLSCKTSIHAWLDLRICILDFGAKYKQRIFLIVSSFLALYCFFMVVMLLNFF